MFKSIGKAFSKVFSRKPAKVTMQQVIDSAKDQSEAIGKHNKKITQDTVSKRFRTNKTYNSKKAKDLAIGYASNAMARNVQKLEPAKRTIRPFGNFRPLKNAWYLPLRSHRKAV